MVRTLARLAGALLAVAGVALTAAGLWFAASLGGEGTARFTARPSAAEPVLVTPRILNRVDADVTVTATASEGARLWMALANPSDAEAVLGRTRRVEVTGVDVRRWALLTTTRGSGTPARLGTADLWRQQDDARGPVSLTVEQSAAPESLVIAADGGTVQSVTLTVAHKRWFVEAVVAVLVGIFLVVAGVVALWPRRRPVPVPPPLEEAGTTGEREVAR